uniref:Uncharacterized protein n=1 Tax=Enterobacter agglomerans TaxID=549 RepID=S0DFF7_ENTAG|nr:hypothetical protein [Pantoea agglomerans]
MEADLGSYCIDFRRGCQATIESCIGVKCDRNRILTRD